MRSQRLRISPRPTVGWSHRPSALPDSGTEPHGSHEGQTRFQLCAPASPSCIYGSATARELRAVCWCCEPKSSHSHGNRIRCSGHANIAPKASPSSSLQGRRREAPVAARAGHQVTQIRPRGAQRNQKATAIGQKKIKIKKSIFCKTANSAASCISRSAVPTAVRALLQSLGRERKR